MSQECVQTQIIMVSRCLKQSAEEAVRAFDEMFQNDILAIESVDKDGQISSPELDKTLAFIDLFFKVAEKPFSEATRETIDNQIQALTQTIVTLGLYEVDETQFTRIIELALNLLKKASEKIAKEFLVSVQE